MIQLEKIFGEIDTDKSGRLSREELEHACAHEPKFLRQSDELHQGPAQENFM